MKRILAALHHTKHNEQVVAAADDLARRFDAQLVWLHAARDPEPPMWTRVERETLEELRSRVVDAARREVLEFLLRQRTGKERDELARTLLVRLGNPQRELLREAEAWQPDLLVVGGHRRREFLDFGNTVRSLLGHSAFPLWVQRGTFTPPRRIRVAIDMSDGSRRALELAAVVARGFGARLSCVHCFSVRGMVLVGSGLYPEVSSLFPTDEARRATEKSFHDFVTEHVPADLGAETGFLEAEAPDGLLASEDEADLTVLGTHGASGLVRTVIGSFAYEFLSRARGAALVVPPPQGA